MRHPRFLLLLTGLFFFGHKFVLGDGPTLRLHVNQQGGYEAMMPASVSFTNTSEPDPIDRSFRSSATEGNISFRAFTRVVSPTPLDAAGTAELSKGLIEFTRERSIKNSNNRLTTDREFKQHGHSAAAFAFRVPNGNGIAIRMRVLFDGSRVHTAVAKGPEQLLSSTAVNTFLDSLGPIGSNAKKRPAAPIVQTRRDRPSGGKTGQASSSRPPKIADTAEVRSLMEKRARLINNFGPNHPAVKSIDREIEVQSSFDQKQAERERELRRRGVN